jgi:hypothetical protein
MVADQIADGVGFSGIGDKVRKLRSMRLMLASPMSAPGRTGIGAAVEHIEAAIGGK